MSYNYFDKSDKEEVENFLERFMENFKELKYTKEVYYSISYIFNFCETEVKLNFSSFYGERTIIKIDGVDCEKLFSDAEIEKYYDIVDTHFTSVEKEKRKKAWGKKKTATLSKIGKCSD